MAAVCHGSFGPYRLAVVTPGKPFRLVPICVCAVLCVALSSLAAASGARTAGPVAQASGGCDGFGGYGYIAKRHRITCRRARFIAAKAFNKHLGPGSPSGDCGPRQTWRMGVWRIEGPIDKWGLTYRFSRGNGQRFTTSKPTEC